MILYRRPWPWETGAPTCMIEVDDNAPDTARLVALELLERAFENSRTTVPADEVKK